MPIVQAHVEIKPELPEYATCEKCHRTYRPRNEEQAGMELCDYCYEAVKYPTEPVISVHVYARPCDPKSGVTR